MGFTSQDILTTLSYVATVVITYGSQAGLFGATNKDVRSFALRDACLLVKAF